MGSSVFVGKIVKVKIIYKYSPRGKTSALESLQNTNIFGIHTRKEENYFLKQAFARNKLKKKGKMNVLKKLIYLER